jgi:tetratricopeptide (TPR) repeat protein
MTTRSPSRRVIGALLLAVLTTGTASSIAAQTQGVLRQGQSPGPRFMVPTLGGDSAGKLGFQIARAVRDRIASDFDIRTLFVVPEIDVTKHLELSGYDAEKALSPFETRQLVQTFHVDELLNGSVIRLPSGGYRVEADWSLSPRDDMVQPLPAVEAAKISDVAKAVAREFHDARRQIESVQKCNALARARNYAGALAEAKKAIDAYPRSVLGRVCIANVYEQQKLGPDSMIRISQEILAIYPTNRRALTASADAYEAKGAVDDLVRTLRLTVAADSMNRPARVRLARVLATAGRISEALPVIDSAVARDPGNVAAVDLQWRVLLAAKEHQRAVRAGGVLAALDSSLATADFYKRMIGAAEAVPDVPAAAALAALGAQRFPADDELGMLNVQLLRRTGEPAKALAALDDILTRSPRTPNALPQKARLEADLGLASADSLLALLGSAMTNGDDRGGIARTALSLGQSAARDSTAASKLDPLRLSIRYYKFAESARASDTTSFLLGSASLVFGQRAATEARTTRQCDLAKDAQAALVDAQISLPKGGVTFREQLGRLMPLVEPTATYADQLVKAICK